MAIRRTIGPVAIDSTGVVVVIRARHADDLPPVVDALIAGGIRAIELTLTTQGTIEAFPALRKRCAEEVSMGIGTVTDLDDCQRALDVGAEFIVTPTTKVPLIELCSSRRVPVFSGGFSPSELQAGWEAGATAVKLFPAGTVGPSYLSQLRGPFPDMRVMPSGGVTIDDIPTWLAAGASAVSLGGPLLMDAFAGGSLSALTERARQCLDAAAESRQQRPS